MLVNLQEILAPADEGGYAVGAFNCYNYETFRGCIAAGEEMGTSVIAAFGAAYLTNMSLDTAHAIVASLAYEACVPICLHLDHCRDMNVIFRAIKSGFGSVMYDGSALPFAENVANTRMVCQVAHACGVSVEAELGCLAVGVDSHEGRAEDVEQYTDPQAAREFVTATEVDALAVSIGTVHGLYKGKPHIRTDILEEIHRAVDVPLVLHGGSGTPEGDPACVYCTWHCQDQCQYRDLKCGCRTDGTDSRTGKTALLGPFTAPGGRCEGGSQEVHQYVWEKSLPLPLIRGTSEP